VETKKNLIAQWAFDARPVLGRFHLWLEDVEVEWQKGVKVPGYTFAPRGIRRCLAVSSAVTALGTKLFGGFGEAVGDDIEARNRVKKSADAVAAYTLSEALWYTTRSLPENHALMVCLGEGLMPKAGETPLMGANPLLGFGRVYARPEVAKFVDHQVRRLLNEPTRTWDNFYSAIKSKGITIWGSAIDTLENTTRFAKGKETGPMSVLHLFDQPLAITKPYESYIATLTVPKVVSQAAEAHSILLDVATPRAKVMQAISLAYPGIEAGNVHVWTLGGASREPRLRYLWEEWAALGVHLVEDGWVGPTGVPPFNDAGPYAPTYMVNSWTDEQGATHLFLADGYAASAEAVQAASLSEALEVDVSLALCSPTFAMPLRDEWEGMRLQSDDPDFAVKLGKVLGRPATDGDVQRYRQGIHEAKSSHIPVGKRVLRADDFFPDKGWRVLATSGYMCTDPYTGTEAVTKLSDDVYRVTSRLATLKSSIRLTFVFRLMKGLDEARLIFSPLLVRAMEGSDWQNRAVKVSDSGRIRNELQTMMSTALEYEGETIRVYVDRIDDSVLSAANKAIVRDVLTWYQHEHPAWFDWLEVMPAGDVGHV